MTAARGDGATRAVSALLLDRAHLLLPIAAQLGEDQPDFESAIRGSSMAPAIPAGARLRVRPNGQQSCRAGDVVFYLAGGGYTVHRVVYRARRPSGADYLLTAGDARFAPDPPVPCRQVLGIVVAIQTDGEWRPLGRRATGPWHRRAVRAVTIPAMVIAMRCSVRGAARLAALLLNLETTARVARRRLLQRWSGGAISNPPTGPAEGAP